VKPPNTRPTPKVRSDSSFQKAKKTKTWRNRKEERGHKKRKRETEENLKIKSQPISSTNVNTIPPPPNTPQFNFTIYTCEIDTHATKAKRKRGKARKETVRTGNKKKETFQHMKKNAY
jgi:hypothetical protein